MNSGDLRFAGSRRWRVPRPWAELGMAGALVAVSLLQSSWEGALSIFGQLPDMALVLLVVWGVRSRRSGVLWAAVGAGLLADLLAGTVPGGQSMALMLAIAPAVTWRFVLFGSTLAWVVCAAVAASAVYYLVFAALLSLQGLDLDTGSTLAAGAFAVPLNCACAAVLHWFCDGFVRVYLWPRRIKLEDLGSEGGSWR